MLKPLLLITIAAILASCAAPQKTQPPRIDPDQVPFTPPMLDIDSNLEYLQQQRTQAAEQLDWVSYILYTEELWLQSPIEQRALIEQDAWITLQAVNLDEQEQLVHHKMEKVRAWGWLLETRQIKGLNFKRALQDLAQIAPDAAFNQHLIPQLISHYDSLDQNRILAVLLPMSDQFRPVSEQIRAGILKAYWHDQANHTLLFYNTRDFTSIEQAYHHAKSKGAQVVIGPLTREEIEPLANLNANDLIALNDIERPTEFVQMSFRNIYEAEQLALELEKQGYQHVGLLSSDDPANTKLVHQIQARWIKYHPHALNIHSYPRRNPNLRHEMSKMIHADQSQSRAGYLSRTLEKPIEFFPRSRQDLEAIILIGDEKQIAVLRPQFDYFGLNLPLYGTSTLTPETLHHAKLNRDLKQIRFPTMPAVLSETPLDNTLQAFGWDSYQLAIHQPLMTDGLSYNGTMGQHSLTEENRVFTRLTWARFLNNGQIVPLNPDKFSKLHLNPKPIELDEAMTEEQIEKIRQELLEEIIRPRSDLLP